MVKNPPKNETEYPLSKWLRKAGLPAYQPIPNLTSVLDKLAIKTAITEIETSRLVPVSLDTEIVIASMSEIPAIALEIKIPLSPRFSFA